MSESVPSSVISFAHRRSRNDSIASFTYLPDEDDSLEWRDEEAVEVESVVDGTANDENDDIEAAMSPIKPKRKSYSQSSIEDPLLFRHESSHSLLGRKRAGGRVNQKIYIVSEDLVAVITGFTTNTFGFVVYVLLCIVTFGTAYLLFRWLPKWRLKLVGGTSPLKDCQWVAIEVSIVDKRKL
jgi:cation-transporting ATPase 13A2